MMIMILPTAKDIGTDYTDKFATQKGDCHRSTENKKINFARSISTSLVRELRLLN
jgi:hypothetical protein